MFMDPTTTHIPIEADVEYVYETVSPTLDWQNACLYMTLHPRMCFVQIENFVQFRNQATRLQTSLPVPEPGNIYCYCTLTLKSKVLVQFLNGAAGFGTGQNSQMGQYIQVNATH